MSDTNTKALLHFNGDNNAVYLDDFGSPKIWTAGGTAKISTAIKKFGRGSLYLDGDTGYISTPDHGDFTLGTTTDKFSFDFWIYLTTLPTGVPFCIFSKVQDASNKYFLEMYDNAGVTTMRFRVREGGVYINDFEWALTALTINTWTHFELTHSDGTMYLYRSGALVSSQAGFSECSDTTGAFEIGRNATVNYLGAYFDEFRYSKGIARHTVASFALSASGYRRAGVDDEYTAFLLHPTGSGAITADTVGATGFTDYADSTNQSTVSTDQYKFAPSSIYMNGSVSSKGIKTAASFRRGVITHRTYGTIDFWVRFTSLAAIQNLYAVGATAQIRYNGVDATKDFVVYALNQAATTVTIPNALLIDTWYHIAIVKNASIMTFYVDGVNVGSGDVATTLATSDTLAEIATSSIYVGPRNLNAPYEYVTTAYFDEYRISPDIQRWTSNFTPETSEYGAQIIEADFTETLMIRETSQTTWDDEQPKVGITDIMDAVREVPSDESPLATISDIMAIVREPTFSDTEQANMSDSMSLILELAITDVQTAGITDIYVAEVFIDEPGINISLPGITFYATGQSDVSGIMSFSVPNLSVLLQGQVDPLGTLRISLPVLGISFSGISSPSGQLNVILPELSFLLTAEIGAVGSISLSIPKISLDITGVLSASGTIAVTIPLFTIWMITSPDSYLNMVMNIRNAALTLYDNYDFNSLCRFNGKHLGATSTKIFDLDTGTLDDDEAIDWNFRTGYLDLEQKTTKKLRQAWLSYKSSGNIILTVIQPDGIEYEYTLEGIEIDETGLRVKFGRGLASKYVALDIKNVDGSSITLDTLQLTLDKLAMRR